MSLSSWRSKHPKSIERGELNSIASFRKCDLVSRETSDLVVNSLMQELFYFYCNVTLKAAHFHSE